MADNSLSGIEGGSILGENVRKTMAFNALSKIYGPIAGDPDTAIKLQEYGQREQTNPIAVQQAQATLAGTNLENTGRQQTNDFNALNNPLLLSTNESGAATAANTAKFASQKSQAELDQTAAATAASKAQTNKTNLDASLEPAESKARVNASNASAANSSAMARQTNLMTNSTAAAQDRAAGAQILSEINDVYTKGGSTADALATFDKHAPIIAKMNGIDASHVQTFRDTIAQGPDAVKQLSDAIGGGGGVIIGATKTQAATVITAAQVDFYADQLNEKGPSVLSNLGNGAGATALKATITARAAQKAIDKGDTAQATLMTQQAFKARQTYVDDLSKSSPTSAGGLVRSAGALLEHAHMMKGYIEALGNGNLRAANAISQEWKQATGSSIPTNLDAQKHILADETARYLIARGGGQKDRDAFAASYEKAGSPSQLNDALDLVLGDVNGQLTAQRQQAVAVNAAQQFDAALTPRARALMGNGPGAAKAGPVEGQIYKDAQGNQARYTNGQYVPVQ